MQITRNDRDTTPGPSEWFTGAVYFDTIATPSDASRLGAINVHFTPGSRTAWHTHPHGQTIYVTEGLGLCQRRGVRRRSVIGASRGARRRSTRFSSLSATATEARPT